MKSFINELDFHFFIIDGNTGYSKAQTMESYIPSNIISITWGGWLNSDEKWFLSSEKDCFKEHVMLCTWPSGIMMNLTESKRYMIGKFLHIFFQLVKHESCGTGPEPGSKGDKKREDEKWHP